MTKHLRRYGRVAGSAVLSVIACAQVPGTGRIHIEPIQSYSGSPPLAKPTAIIVYNFASTPEEVKLNHSVLNRVRMRLSGAQNDEKTELAHKIADRFSESLVKDLQKTGLPVSRSVAGELPPDGALAVQGDFLLIDEGNRARRMAIGLGMGASKVETNVQCFLKQPARNVLVTQFRATSQSSRKPGAAETMGVGAAPDAAAAVSGATELRQGAEGDTDRMAKAISKEITKTITAQGWIQAIPPSEKEK